MIRELLPYLLMGMDKMWALKGLQPLGTADNAPHNYIVVRRVVCCLCGQGHGTLFNVGGNKRNGKVHTECMCRAKGL